MRLSKDVNLRGAGFGRPVSSQSRDSLGYKTDDDISEVVKNGQWGKAYAGEFDRKTQILTILPLDSAKRRTEKLIVSR